MCEYIKYDKESQKRSNLDISNNTLYNGKIKGIHQRYNIRTLDIVSE